MNFKKINVLFGVLFAAVFFVHSASAYLVLDGVSVDPAIIAAGDEVTIIASTHLEGENTGLQKSVEELESYTLKATLMPEDSIAEKYILVLDDGSKNNIGAIYPSDKWNSDYRVKVLSDAPAGTYKMKIRYEYYRNGVAMGEAVERMFFLDVKKEGIIVGVSNVNTNPLRVRPGDDFVELILDVENSGEKKAKNVEVMLVTPKGITPSYANNNRVWVGVLDKLQSKSLNFVVDVEDFVLPGVYEFDAKINYMDLDNNRYYKIITLPFLVKEKPILSVVSTNGGGLAGKDAQISVVVKNVGSETAEFVDVRIIKQTSQPFDFVARSSYVGDLEPGEEGVAVFDIAIGSDAQIKEHDLKLILRAKGDSDKGDDNIYTFSRRATLSVDGVAPNLWKQNGSYLVAIFVVFLIGGKVYGYVRGRKK